MWRRDRLHASNGGRDCEGSYQRRCGQRVVDAAHKFNAVGEGWGALR